MKWLISALGTTVTAAALTQAGAIREPVAGVELVVHEPESKGTPAPLGTFEIDGLERDVSVRAALHTGTASVQLSLPPGLYGVRFVPDPESAGQGVLAMPPSVFLVVPRSMTRVDVRLRGAETPRGVF